MKYVQLFSFKHPLCNVVLESKSKDIPALHATKYRDHADRLIYLSYYRLGFWQRIRFLFCGVLQVHVMQPKQPPIAVGFGDYFKTA